MSEDDYTTLIEFMILTSDMDLSKINFVTADYDGWIWGYKDHPVIDHVKRKRWVQDGYGEHQESPKPIKITEIEPEHPSWDKIVVEL